MKAARADAIRRQSMHGNTMLTVAATIDVRYLHVECPEHPGITLPVTRVRSSHARHSSSATRIFVEAHCKYCDGWHYCQLPSGDADGLPKLEWNA